MAASLTERDQRICADLYEHRLLTTNQVFELHFSSQGRARKRMLELYQLGLVWRTRPQMRPGSLPNHYVLDDLGALVVAEARGIDPDELRFRRDRGLGLIDSPRLLHLRETNGFFTRLVHACRTTGQGHRLEEWWGERRSARRWDGLVRPDGIGHLRGEGYSVSFALELDRGTESRDRLEAKLERYAMISSGADAPDVVVFCFPTDGRERSAREVLRAPGVAVATTTQHRHLGDPLGPVWRPVGDDRRVALLDLGGRS